VTDALKSQCAGLGLALTTAVGVIAYERLVKNFSYFMVGLMVSLSYVPFWLLSLLQFSDQAALPECGRIKEQKWFIIIFMMNGITGPLWYCITRKQNALVGATYEAKYILVMVLLYIAFGYNRPTWNTLIGVCLAIASIYFISKPT
jgi:drug/metabolite transporter (DMT)-like permease